MVVPVLPHVCLPVNLDAFVLNQDVCKGSGLSLVAPITQPKYASIRLSNNQAQHDILPAIDLHDSAKQTANARVSSMLSNPFTNAKDDPEPSDQQTATVNRQRMGIYLHWSVPRGFRNATSQASPPPPIPGDDVQVKKDTNAQPAFPLIPNRWLVVRTLYDWSPPEAFADKQRKVTAWIIESDRLRKLENLDQDENGQPIDLETDVAPFTAYEGKDPANDSNLLDSQANNFLGNKLFLADWQEHKLRKDQRREGAASNGSAGAEFVDLTVMNSSNPLFADYTAHNGNVFSLKDNLYCGNGRYLTGATCDYAVFGWHSDYADDPLWATGSNLSDRLQKQFCTYPGAEREEFDPAKDPRTQNLSKTRLICHAAKYNVVYSSRKPDVCKADAYAKLFTTDVDMEPVAVGTTPLDAMMGFFQAHNSVNDPELDSVFDSGSKTAAQLMDIRELLYATEDDYESRVKAADLVFSHNFGRSQGGSIWQFNKKKKPDQSPAAPSDQKPVSDSKDNLDHLSEKELITEINKAQRIADSAAEKLSLIQWSLFSEWFKYVSDPHSDLDIRKDLYTTRVPLLRREAQDLQHLLDAQQSSIESMQTKVPVKKIASESFFKRTDPTLCIAGIDAGWDVEYLRGTPTRFADALSPAGSPNTDMSPILNLLGRTERFSSDSRVDPELIALCTTLRQLLDEFSRGFNSDLDQFGCKKWAGQPFRPQFVEWEGIYHHIPYNKDNWEVQLTNSAISATNHKQIMYATKKTLSDMPEVLADVRSVAGRMLILPQPSFSLGAVVAQVLTATPNPNLPEALRDQKHKDALAQKAASMNFISGELTGLTEALVTQVKGQHVKPNLRVQGKDRAAVLPIAEAVIAGRKIGLDTPDFITIASESGNTPYGTLERFPNAGPPPFKGVQHGQFAITKLVIVDKFAQAICCPLTKRLPRPGISPPRVPDFVHPCLSEQLMPSVVDGSLNTVYTTTDTHDATTKAGVPMTPFMQLNPAINQEVRLNACFLKQILGPGGTTTTWQPCSDWENPIFGWIIVNYADEAVQFFTADGTYYTSVRFGGPLGTVTGLKWLPFDAPPPVEAAAKVSPQLIALIAQMTNSPATSDRSTRYLAAFWETIRAAIPNMPFPPSEYAAYANAIVGKPLALVNAGWSLELAQPAYWRQHTLPAPSNPASNDTVDPLRVEAQATIEKYSFPLKIGDADRSFDGVVAYWDIDAQFKTFFSYKVLEGHSDIATFIEPQSFPSVSPYYIDPLAAGSADFVEQHTKRLMIKTLLIDPYTPLHVWSGILPISSLKLPGWTIQDAMKNMTAFFAVGPILVTRDVPAVYDPTRPLTTSSWQDMQTQVAGDSAVPVMGIAGPGSDTSVRLPIAGGKGMWNWLQPYVEGAATKYNALAVTAEDGNIRQDPAPYTLLEGYLQLARPLVQPVLEKPK